MPDIVICGGLVTDFRKALRVHLPGLFGRYLDRLLAFCAFCLLFRRRRAPLLRILHGFLRGFLCLLSTGLLSTSLLALFGRRFGGLPVRRRFWLWLSASPLLLLDGPDGLPDFGRYVYVLRVHVGEGNGCRRVVPLLHNARLLHFLHDGWALGPLLDGGQLLRRRVLQGLTGAGADRPAL